MQGQFALDIVVLEIRIQLHPSIRLERVCLISNLSLARLVPALEGYARQKLFSVAVTGVDNWLSLAYMQPISETAIYY